MFVFEEGKEGEEGEDWIWFPVSYRRNNCYSPISSLNSGFHWWAELSWTSVNFWGSGNPNGRHDESLVDSRLFSGNQLSVMGLLLIPAFQPLVVWTLCSGCSVSSGWRLAHERRGVAAQGTISEQPLGDLSCLQLNQPLWDGWAMKL